MEIINTTARLKSAVQGAKDHGDLVGLVPTMGALHQGHMSLVERALKECDFVVVSIFVNPTQFNNPDDLRTYPRTVEADCDLLAKAGVNVAFVPTVEEVYPTPDTRQFDLGPVAEVMEGAMRPGHFNGVAQVVSKLFDMVEPDKAYFGEKDYQQIAVIRRMAQLEGFDDIDIVACPIKRADDGLALSSRNVRLTAEQRAAAPAIHRILAQSVEDARAGMPLHELRLKVADEINATEGMKLEYFEIVDGDTMQPIARWADSTRPVGCITVWMGDVRLIDNIKY